MKPGRPWSPTNGLPVESETVVGRSRGFRIIQKTRSSKAWMHWGFPRNGYRTTLSLQLTALPGWAGFIKWRGEERDYPWQQAYPVGLVKFLAIRLWYARELVYQACKDHLDIEGRYEAVMAYMHDYPEEYYLRRQRVAGRLPALYAEEVDRLSHQKGQSWKNILTRYRTQVIPRLQAAVRRGAARRLLALAHSLNIDATVLVEGTPQT